MLGGGVRGRFKVIMARHKTGLHAACERLKIEAGVSDLKQLLTNTQPEVTVFSSPEHNVLMLHWPEASGADVMVLCPSCLFSCPCAIPTPWLHVDRLLCCPGQQNHTPGSHTKQQRIGEARALYNLGNVYHAKGKQTGRSGNQDPGEFPAEVKECLVKAAEYYEANLAIVQELGDRAAQGRACGNLGNTHFLLGNFSQAIIYHQELSGATLSTIKSCPSGQELPFTKFSKSGAALCAIKSCPFSKSGAILCAIKSQKGCCLNRTVQMHRPYDIRPFGDKAAERRAYSNLGNAHIFLGEFEVAAEHYRWQSYIFKRKTLQIAKQLGDKALEAQACYSLGNTYTLLKDYERAREFHMKHLKIAQELEDRVGEGRACWSLGNAHTALGHNEEALQYASKHLEISKEVSQETDHALLVCSNSL
ncbi:hypothetical protein DPMN_146535 [Dreissena polymorpha]|uniref:Uncharacterized protein n=1 Tax=Dreissena polymorpha TaxID=45954 RepID=A0A9D4F8T0_DREPO|nr:hypothetical protein DPMN_146535 [Dreissena polymorpha]